MIEVFICPVGPGDDAVLDALCTTLDDEERGQAARFAFARDRRSYVAAHALLRFAVAACAGRWRWRILRDANGKPRLEPAAGSPRFSLTHAEGVGAVAIAHGPAAAHEVGLDMEPAARDPDEAALGALALAPPEIAELDRHADRRQRLLRLWVAKEAIAKAAGRGLSLPLQQVVLRDDPPQIAALPADCGSPSGWSLHTSRERQHWLGLAAPVPAMRFALRVVSPAGIGRAGA